MSIWQRIVRAWRGMLAGWRGEAVVTAETVADDSPVAVPERGPKNVRATRKVDGLEIVLYHGREKGKGRRACEHSVALGNKGITFTVDGVDRTPPEWK